MNKRMIIIVFGGIFGFKWFGNKMMNDGGGHRLEMWLDRQFDRLRHGYQRRLHGALDDKHVVAVFGVIVLVSTYFLYLTSPRELAPEEDQGIILIFSQSDPYSSLDYLTRFTSELTNIANALPEKENYFLMNGVGGSGSAVGTNTAISGIVFKPWDERERTTKIDKPQIHIDVDRDKAALLGIDMRQLGSELAAMMSGGYVNRFSMESRSYKVIPQVQRTDRLNTDQLTQLLHADRVRPTGAALHAGHATRVGGTAAAQTLPTVERRGHLWHAAAEVLPPGYAVDYAGQSRQYKTEGAALVLTFFFALIIIYLVLAAQFESFRDPIVMLVTVPMCSIGLVIATGMTIGTLFTLFVVPAVYLYLGRDDAVQKSATSALRPSEVRA